MRTRRLRLVLALVALVAAGCRQSDPTTASAERDAPDTSQQRAKAAKDGGGSEQGSCQRKASEGQDPIEFTDATDAARLDEPLRGMFGHAAALADVNADGWLDLFVGTFADKADERYQLRGATGPSPDRLLLGGKDGFTVDARFPEQYGRTSAAAFADLDGDGDADLVVMRNAAEGRSKASHPMAGSTVFRNDGGGAFAIAGELPTGPDARAAAVLDYDGDGALDIFVARDPRSSGAAVLLRNEGGLRFRDATRQAGLPTDARSLGALAADLDGDRKPDLFTGERLFVNRGGRFEEVKIPALAWERFGKEDDVAGVAAGDLDGDGRLDLVVGQHFNSTLSHCREVPIRIFLNRTEKGQRLSFTNVTAAAGVPAFPGKAPHVEIEDYDNDGRPDILATVSAGRGTVPAVLRQVSAAREALRFEGVHGLGDPQYWVTGMSGDVDHDGRLDLFLAEFEPSRPSLLLRNTTSRTGAFLSITVPPSSVGAVLEVYRAGGLGKSADLIARRPVATGVGYGAGAPFTLHVGLGEVRAADVRLVPAWRGAPIDRLEVPAGTSLALG